MGTIKEHARWGVVVFPFQCGEIDQEIEIMYDIMVVEIINVSLLFMGFVKTFSQDILWLL